jgi:PAS domain-containing protein
MYRVDIPDIFARFLATQDIGLAVKGLDGRYLYANPGYARLLGISADAVVQGRQDEDLLPEPAACALVEAQASVQSNAGAAGVEFPPGSREEAAVPLLVTHFPVLDVQGQLDAIGVVAVPRHAK